MPSISQVRHRKKWFIGVPAVLAAGLAQAQTSVTLYGVLDTNMEYVTNMSSVTPSAANAFAVGPGHDLVRLNSGGLSGSRWGMRGAEDLGSGLKAVFVLESGFGVDDGKSTQGGRLFGRQAFVGLDHAQAGKVTFGRQYTSLFDGLTNFSPMAYSLQYEPLIALTGVNFRSDNVAKYTGQFGGLGVLAHWSFGNGAAGAGEVPGQFRRDTGYGAALNYAAGAFAAGIAYDQYNPTLNATGGTGTFKKAAVAASYAVGNAKLMGGYRWGRNISATDAILLRDNYYWIGGNYQATSALSLTLAYYYDDVKNLGGVNIKNPWQVTFMADYSFSKRTDVYLTTAFSKNSGLNFDTSAISFANGYFLGSDKTNMFGAAIGIRHKF
ncbi:porin [Cupriavidus lacunae]|uniref:Porin n=1 Tax=Cupriavidus lacunae TaxID=2666307 RepID=A0A370P1X0_9BURK|nr:porin [Cupriavidus lacunae]RDK11860.1 porin [Cupriavidus lacunae]